LASFLWLHARADRAGRQRALVESVDQAVAAVETLAALDRTLCRRSFEERFTTARMARDYVGVYERLVEEAVSSPGQAVLPSREIPIPAPVAAEERPPAWVSTGHDHDESGGAVGFCSSARRVSTNTNAPAVVDRGVKCRWLRGQDLNLRP
jgi:hypothetical protein